jgi:hypothetical protein
MSRTEETFSAKDRRPLANRMDHPRLGSAWNGLAPSRKGNSNAMAARQTCPSEQESSGRYLPHTIRYPKVRGRTYGSVIVEAEERIQLDVFQ